MAQAQVRLWWLPVGAGGHVVIHTSRWWELRQARREHRPPQPLFHAALEVDAGTGTWVIEMAPAWGRHRSPRGVVATGPVGHRILAVSPLFRYEVRCWPGGVIDDLAYAAGGPVVFPLSPADAAALLRRTVQVPLHVWGTRMPGGDMWNSNSLASWLLEGSGIDAAELRPPEGGRAPGWAAGVQAARLPPATAPDQLQS